jgi:ribosomal protein L22
MVFGKGKQTIAWNKGTKGIIKSNSGSFKKGHKINNGKKYNENHKINLSESHKGLHISPLTEFKKGHTNGFKKGHEGFKAMLGKKRAEEATKKTLETINKNGGYPKGKEHQMFGKKHTEITKKKMKRSKK